MPPSFQRQDYSFRGFRAQPTRGPFSGACFTRGSFSHFRKTVRTSLESSLPEAQLQREGTGTAAKSELDLEDKYNIASFDNDLILTNDYYEYEQGQKEIIVKGRLKIISTFWKTVLKANSSVVGYFVVMHWGDFHLLR